VHVAGLDAQELGELASAPCPRWLAGDDLGDARVGGWSGRGVRAE
jgi:hypothetical protein